MNDQGLHDMAVAGNMTAKALRDVWPGLDDERIKRKVLAGLGWKFSRRKGEWVKDGRSVDPELGLEAVLTILCLDYATV